MAKAKLTFADINTTVVVPSGTRLIEVSEKVGAGIVYGCRENDCGNCLFEVVEGVDHLSKPSPLESKLLREKFARPNQRLACQAMVLGDLTVKPA